MHDLLVGVKDNLTLLKGKKELCKSVGEKELCSQRNLSNQILAGDIPRTAQT